MTSHARLSSASDHLPTPGDLASLQAEFPGYRIWREVTGEHVRLVAVRRTHGASPHTVVTADVTELRAALNGPPAKPAKSMTTSHARHRGRVPSGHC